MINNVRRLGTTAAEVTGTEGYTAAVYHVSNAVWRQRQNNAVPAETRNVTVLGGNAQLGYSNNFFKGSGNSAAASDTTKTLTLSAAYGAPALLWAEGLALGANNFATEWKSDSAFRTLNAPSGSTTSSRASLSGKVTGLLTETAYFYQTKSVDAVDLMRFLMVNDGAGNQMRNTMFLKQSSGWNKTFTHTGMAYTVESGCNISSVQACWVMFTVMASEGYTNNAGVTECQPVINYGGGICTPTTDSASLYEVLNDFRKNANSKYAAQFTTWVADSANWSAVDTKYTQDWNGTGVTSAKTFISKKAGFGFAATDLSADNLVQFEWSPGLYLTAIEHANYLAGQTALTSTGPNGSFSQRSEFFGTPTANTYEILYKGPETAANSMYSMIVDDLNNSSAGASTQRNTLKNASMKLAGVGYVPSTATAGSKVAVIMLDTAFQSYHPYSDCQEAVAAYQESDINLSATAL